jgi:hypothetical protein
LVSLRFVEAIWGFAHAAWHVGEGSPVIPRIRLATKTNPSWCGRRPFSSPGERRSYAAARAAPPQHEVKMIRKPFVIALFVTAFVSVVQAQDRKALRDACMGDAKKFCADVQRGGGRIVKCLRDHATDLTPGCRDGLASLKQQ